jgi:hypothetical protein
MTRLKGTLMPPLGPAPPSEAARSSDFGAEMRPYGTGLAGHATLRTHGAGWVDRVPWTGAFCAHVVPPRIVRVTPASMTSTCPVTHRASSLAR